MYTIVITVVSEKSVNLYTTCCVDENTRTTNRTGLEKNPFNRSHVALHLKNLNMYNFIDR
jgi:hypothetical protein